MERNPCRRHCITAKAKRWVRKCSVQAVALDPNALSSQNGSPTSVAFGSEQPLHFDRLSLHTGAASQKRRSRMCDFRPRSVTIHTATRKLLQLVLKLSEIKKRPPVFNSTRKSMSLRLAFSPRITEPKSSPVSRKGSSYRRPDGRGRAGGAWRRRGLAALQFVQPAVNPIRARHEFLMRPHFTKSLGAQHGSFPRTDYGSPVVACSNNVGAPDRSTGIGFGPVDNRAK
jgi:hypothetical protein